VVTLDEYLDILQRGIIAKENVAEITKSKCKEKKRSKIRRLLMKGL